MNQSLPRLWHILGHFWPWIRQERPLITASMAALLAGVVVRLAEPWPLKFILDRVIPSERPPATGILRTIESWEPLTLLTVMAVSVVVLTGLRALLEYHQRLGFAKIGNRVLRRLRVHVYQHLQTLSPSFHESARSGDLIVRVTRDVSLLRDVTSTAVLPLLASVAVLAGMVAIVLALQWQLALLAMVTVPAFVVMTARLGRGIHEAARKQRKREGAMAATAAESIHAIREVQALSLENEFAGAFSSRNDQSQKEDLKAARLSAKLGRTVDLLLAVATALVLWFGTLLVLRAKMTPGDLVIFLTYLKRAFKPAKDFAKYTGRLAKATAAGERVLAVLEQEPEVRDRPDAVPAPRFGGEIEFEDVTFGYGPDADTLHGVSFRVAGGTRVALTGPSGSGKSTLLQLLLRLRDPGAGRIMIDGRDVRDYTVASVRSQMSVVLQDTVLFAATVAENIALGAADATAAEIEWAARQANAHDFIRRLPQGYDTVIGERGATVSAGQKQRISIARALLRGTRILILDEPATGLDERSENAIAEALGSVPRGTTTIVVTHDIREAERADQVVYIDNGRVCEVGSPQELMRAGGEFARLSGLQLRARMPNA